MAASAKHGEILLMVNNYCYLNTVYYCHHPHTFNVYNINTHLHLEISTDGRVILEYWSPHILLYIKSHNSLTNWRFGIASLAALLLRVEPITIPLAAAVHKLLAVTIIGIEVPPLKVGLTWPCILGQGTDIWGINSGRIYRWLF